MHPDKPPIYGRGDLMVTAAFRYCIGRQTYIVSECVEWLMNIWPTLSESTRRSIKRELDDEIKRDDYLRGVRRTTRTHLQWLPLGGDCDRRQWLHLRDFIKEHTDEPR